jgi:Fe-S cluster assembly protein SufD
VVFVTTERGMMTHPRMLLVAGENAEATIVESHLGSGGDYFTNVVSEFACAESSNVAHCKLQRESTSAFHVATQHAVLGSNSRFATENVSFGGSLVRNDINSILDGEGIDCRVDGLYLASGRQHVDNHTFIRHAKPHCHSFELYKGILNGKARGVFNGKIYVDPDAQKTDAKQSNSCILLSDAARVNTQPQLEIFADDVKCTHGATVGQLDEDAVFYLRSRGVPAAEARNMLVYAFAAELLERITVDTIREQLETELFQWLQEYYAQEA